MKILTVLVRRQRPETTLHRIRLSVLVDTYFKGDGHRPDARGLCRPRPLRADVPAAPRDRPRPRRRPARRLLGLDVDRLPGDPAPPDCCFVEDTAVVLDEVADLAPFDGIDVVPIPADEPGAANVLRVAGSVIAHSGFPRTIDLLAARGVDVRPIDVSEFLKAEAGVTCKSIVFHLVRGSSPGNRPSYYGSAGNGMFLFILCPRRT